MKTYFSYNVENCLRMILANLANLYMIFLLDELNSMLNLIMFGLL